MKQLTKIVAFVFVCLILMKTVTAHKVIAGDESDFLSVTGPCNLTFPKDHGPHPGYRTEWWYYTGNLIPADIFSKPDQSLRCAKEMAPTNVCLADSADLSRACSCLRYLREKTPSGRAGCPASFGIGRDI
jgi:predicted secreted hydrolase